MKSEFTYYHSVSYLLERVSTDVDIYDVIDLFSFYVDPHPRRQLFVDNWRTVTVLINYGRFER